jgi:Arc/MetJ-type ribon-helix-helix transcriptional regulator
MFALLAPLVGRLAGGWRQAIRAVVQMNARERCRHSRNRVPCLQFARAQVIFSETGFPKMEQASLTISLPRSMKDFIEAKLREGRFSTPSEYVRSLIGDDQDLSGHDAIATLMRRAGLVSAGEQTAAGRIDRTDKDRPEKKRTRREAIR